MKSKILMLLVFCFCFFLFKDVNAETYTYEIGDGKEWNVSNFSDLDDLVHDLWDADQQDNKFENKYIFNFSDGNYDFSHSYFELPEGYVEINFGEGNYKFDYLGFDERYGSYIVKGKGMNKTFVSIDDYILSELAGQAEFCDISLLAEGLSPGICSSRQELDNCGLNDVSLGLVFKNVDITLTSNDSMSIYYLVEDVEPYFEFDNVKFGDLYRVELYLEGVNFIPKDKKYVVIKDSDFSNVNLEINNRGDLNKIPVVFIENTNLKKVTNFDAKVNIDCDSKFVDGIKRYDLYANENQYDEDEATLIYGDNSKTVLGVCKNKQIKINKSITLSDLKNETGFDIDRTWNFDPEGIVELRDNQLIPLKTGDVKIYKEINGEMKVLRLKVLPVDKSLKNIVNPKTSRSLIVMLLIVVLIVSSVFVINRKKYVK